MFEGGFRLLGSLGEWITFPQHQILVLSTVAFVLKNPLKPVLLFTIHKKWRQWLILKLRGSQCIGGRSVPPTLSC